MAVPPLLDEQSQWTGFLRQTATTSDKSWWIALILSGLFGSVGADRLYLGYPLLGMVKLATGGGGGVWWIYDFLRLVFGKMKDGDGKVVERPF